MDYARLTSLADVVAQPALALVDVIPQDEYTHDVVVRDRAGFVVFDATWLGAINGFSVWDHRPTADELLSARLARGWTPTPTSTVDGPVVLGHAACRFPAPAARS